LFLWLPTAGVFVVVVVVVGALAVAVGSLFVAAVIAGFFTTAGFFEIVLWVATLPFGTLATSVAVAL
jgi:hypothetical protein